MPFNVKIFYSFKLFKRNIKRVTGWVLVQNLPLGKSRSYAIIMDGKLIVKFLLNIEIYISMC